MCWSSIILECIVVGCSMHWLQSFQLFRKRNLFIVPATDTTVESEYIFMLPRHRSILGLGKVNSAFHPYRGQNKFRTKHMWKLITGVPHKADQLTGIYALHHRTLDLESGYWRRKPCTIVDCSAFERSMLQKKLYAILLNKLFNIFI